MRRTLNRISTCYWFRFNTLNLDGSFFILERERERTYVASLARQDNHYLFNSKDLAFLTYLGLRKNNSDFSGFFPTNFCRLFNNVPYSFSFCSAKFSTLFSNRLAKILTSSVTNMHCSAKFLTSSATNIITAGFPGTNFHKTFSKVSQLKSVAPLVKVEPDTTVQIGSMYVFANVCGKEFWGMPAVF